jgi:hypothetical protein
MQYHVCEDPAAMRSRYTVSAYEAAFHASEKFLQRTNYIQKFLEVDQSCAIHRNEIVQRNSYVEMS